MTRTLAEPLLGPKEAPEPDVAPPAEDLLNKESPRLGKIHERTNAIVDRMLDADPRRFQELSGQQQSGQ